MLEVQKYLKEKGLDSLAKEFNIKVTDYDKICVLNYNQIEFPRFHLICDECRALILEKGTWNVVAMSFVRFYNTYEGFDFNSCKVFDPVRIASFNKEPQILSFPIEDAFVENKLDGCCSEETLILSQNGPITIRELCEKKEKVKILAFDTNLMEFVFTEIIAFSVKNNNNDWFEIELENGNTIKLTSEHYVWLADLKCYRMVKDLKEGDYILLSE